MSDDQVGCEWVSVSSGTGLPGLSRQKMLNGCVCVLLLDSYKIFYIAAKTFHVTLNVFLHYRV